MDGKVHTITLHSIQSEAYKTQYKMVFVVSIRDFPEKKAFFSKKGDTFLDLFNKTITLATIINVS